MPRFHKGKGSMTGKVDQISVIVPVYNGEAYLEACIESIRDQTYPDLEIIIVNDGSTDGTAGLCAKLQDAYENVHVITMRDEGVSAARNAGIEAASGDFLTFVDADDRLRPQMIKTLYDCIISTDSDIAGCGFLIWRSEEEWKKACEEKEKEPPTVSSAIYDPDSYLRNALLQGNSRCWSKLYRKSAIGKTRFRTGISIGEDMLFLMDLLSSVKRINEIEYPGYGYYQNPGGVMRRSFTPAYMDQVYCWETARELIVKQDEALAVQADAQIMVAIMLTVGKIALLFGKERKKAEEYLRVCHRKLKGLAGKKACYASLPSGYGIKVRMFTFLPGLYVYLYRLQKNRKEKFV